LLTHVPDDHPDRDVLVALLLTFCYLECLVFWEYSTEYGPMTAVLDVVVERASDEAVRVAHDATLAPLLDALAEVSRSLVAQFEVEKALLCACPITLSRTARVAATSLATAQTHIDRVAGDAGHDMGEHVAMLRGTRAGLEAVLRESISDGCHYFQLLADHVGPSARAFSDNLFLRDADDDVRAQLGRAIDEVHRLIDTVDVDDDHGRILGVFRSEARAHGRALEAMSAILGDGPATARPTLVVDQGEIHYLYPFGLPVGDSGEDFVQRALLEHLSGGAEPRVEMRPTLAGCRVTIEDALQTEGFHHAAGILDGTAKRSGARLVFADDRLVLETAAGVQYTGLEVEVLLGPLGNHVVRVGLNSDVARGWSAEAAARGMDEEIPARWTPHELHQFLHRGGIDFGDERLFFVAEDPTAATGVPPCDRSFPSIVGLAATIVKHLHDAVRHLEEGERQAAIARGDMPATGGDLADTDPVARELDVEERGNQLRQLGHVLIVLNDASSVLDGATRHLATPRGLAACAGAEPVLTSQPPCPRVLEEWTCAPPLPEKTADGTDGLLGSMDSQVLCNGDTTLLFAPSSPNWQILEDRELVTFAISLGTAYADGR
jgi:hypothetical protein